MMDAADTALATLTAAKGMIAEMTIHTDKMATASQGREILATDYADHLVRDRNLPFREAYIQVAEHIRTDSQTQIDIPNITPTDSINARNTPAAPHQNKSAKPSSKPTANSGKHTYATSGNDQIPPLSEGN